MRNRRRLGAWSLGLAVTAATLVSFGTTTASGAEHEVTAAPAARTAAAPAAVAAKKKRKGWYPTEGAKFNVARAGGEAELRLELQVIAAINRAKPGSYLKMAMFSFDRMPVADALVAAKRRGVFVQVIVNDHELPGAQRKLKNVLGPRTVKKKTRHGKKIKQRRNFFYQCTSSCRGDGDVQHSKFVLFTRTGAARNVVMLGSLNMKRNGSLNQFNDLLTINDNAKLHGALDEIFDEMRKDKVLKKSYRKFKISKKMQLEVMPFPRTKATAKTRWTPQRDPIIKLLKPVKCRGARTNTGRTIIRVDMHAWDKDRGALIANRFRDLYAAGCDVKVHVGFAGGRVRDVFARPTSRGLVPVRSTGFDTDEDGEVDLYSHAKILLINGNYDGRPGQKMVVTGSSNYQNGGQYGDELIFRVFDPALYRQYADNWGYLWRNHTHGFAWGGTLRPNGKFKYTLRDPYLAKLPDWRDE